MLEVVQNVLELGFKGCLYAKIVVDDWNYSWCCFVLLGALILRIILIDSFADEVSTPSSLIKTCMRVFGFVLVCSVLFKLDNLSGLSWIATFWYLLL